jgi:hypothetical protein
VIGERIIGERIISERIIGERIISERVITPGVVAGQPLHFGTGRGTDPAAAGAGIGPGRHGVG